MRVPDTVIRAVLEHLGEEVAVCDVGGRVVRVNEAWGDRSATTLAEAFDDPTDVTAWLRECLDKPLGRVTALARKRGGWVWLSVSALVDEFRDTVGVLAEVESAAALEERLSAVLSAREKEVAFFVLQGLPARTVADRLGLSEATVKTHMGQIYRKTGTRSRHELAALAERGAPGEV